MQPARGNGDVAGMLFHQRLRLVDVAVDVESAIGVLRQPETGKGIRIAKVDGKIARPRFRDVAALYKVPCPIPAILVDGTFCRLPESIAQACQTNTRESTQNAEDVFPSGRCPVVSNNVVIAWVILVA